MHRFDEHSAIEASGENAYRATLAAEWTIANVPNGGIQAAISARAAMAALETPDVMNISTTFIKATSPGPIELDVEVLRRGRTTSLAQVRLMQDGVERTRSQILGGTLGAKDGVDLHRTEPPTLPPPQDCPRLSPAISVTPRLMDEIELRFHPDHAGFLRGETGGAPEIVAWLRLVDERPPDSVALACFADVLPPTTFNLLGITGWVPTLELTTQIRRRPVPGWLRIRMITRHITAGHFEEDGELWDESGALVAISRQRALLIGAR